MSGSPIPTWTFALVVVRDGDRFVVVQERKHHQTWYFPGGRVEPGERIADGALRETREEAGIDVVLEGVLRIEHRPVAPAAARLRVFFLARPAGPLDLKTAPDDESLGARWVTLDELHALPLRGEEVRTLFRRVASGGVVHPLDVLTDDEL